MGEGEIFCGVDEIEVDLVGWSDNPYYTIYRMAVAGEYLEDTKDKARVEEVVRDVLKGGMQNALESVSYTFAINNVSRATTHQLVRTRVGAGFLQHSMRYNQQNFSYRMPQTIRDTDEWVSIRALMQKIHRHYERLVELDVPYQDARSILPIGTTTHIVASYNFRALKDFCSIRMCNNMQWEIHQVADLMAKRVKEVHPILGEALVCRCDALGKCAYYGVEDSCGRWGRRRDDE